MIRADGSGEDLAPDIFGYHEYREFLRDHLQYLKATQQLSLRQIAKKSGVSESYISMVISGSRRLSEGQLQKLVPALQLERSAASYLGWLIDVVDADSPEAQLEALKKVQGFRSYRNLNPLEVRTYKYLEHWYHVAIRELAHVTGFNPDPKWVQAALRFKVGLAEVKQAIEFLIENRFLEFDAHGGLKKSGKLITCESGVLKAAMTKFHTEMLTLAAHSLTDTDSEERNITAFTSPLPSECVPEAKRILEEARQKIVELTQRAGPGDTVYHFGFLAFPLSRKPGDKT